MGDAGWQLNYTVFFSKKRHNLNLPQKITILTLKIRDSLSNVDKRPL